MNGASRLQGAKGREGRDVRRVVQWQYRHRIKFELRNP